MGPAPFVSSQVTLLLLLGIVISVAIPKMELPVILDVQILNRKVKIERLFGVELTNTLSPSEFYSVLSKPVSNQYFPFRFLAYEAALFESLVSVVFRPLFENPVLRTNDVYIHFTALVFYQGVIILVSMNGLSFNNKIFDGFGVAVREPLVLALPAAAFIANVVVRFLFELPVVWADNFDFGVDAGVNNL